MHSRLLFYIFFLMVFTPTISQQTRHIDFKTATAKIDINPKQQTVSGTIQYDFVVLKKTDTVFIDAIITNFKNVYLDDKEATFEVDDKRLMILQNFTEGNTHSLSFDYEVVPKKTMYFIGWDYLNAKKQVWTQGQGKYTSHWLPSFDDMNEKVIFDLQISFDKDYEVIANGALKKSWIEGNKKIWQYDMHKPMSSYLLALAIGKYQKKEIQSKSRTPISLYYYPEDSLKVEPTYRYSQQIFDFLEEEIGVAYPWQNYKQIPVKDFLYAGMENTTATIFSDSYVIDSIAFADKNYVNVNAHELAHQWFGDMVTEVSATHHWLQEGFATYYALLAEKKIFGDDYFYWKLYSTYLQLSSIAESGDGQALLDPKASSLTFYEKGAWALYVLRSIIGDKAFKASIKKYLFQYQFKNVQTQDFIKIATATSGKDLTTFVDTWLKSKDFPKEEALGILTESTLIKQITDIKNDIQNKDKTQFITEVLRNQADKIENATWYYPVISLYFDFLKETSPEVSIEFYRKTLASQDPKLRQQSVIQIDSIPLSLKDQFVSLLSDESYVTIENALFKLWLNFPEERVLYLNKTKDIHGFNDKRLRTLWLTLALATSNYNSRNTPLYYKELAAYTLPTYHFEIRQHAFQFLYQLQALNNQNLIDLIQACRHPVWQFSKSSKELLRQLLKDSVYKKRYEEIFSELSTDNKTFLKKYLQK